MPWNHGAGWDDTDVCADERHRGLRRLATGRVRHVLFRAPVRRMLEKAPSDPKACGILFDNNAERNRKIKVASEPGRLAGVLQSTA